MVEDSREAARGADAWDEYWRLTPEAAAHRAGGPQEAALARFWGGILERHAAGGRRILDFACGNGAFTTLAEAAAGKRGGDAADLFGFDRAPAAVRSFRQRHRGACAVVADARGTPFPDRAFDLVASQFGLEYAGIESVPEAVRLVAPAGDLALVLHLKGGPLQRECEASARAIGRLEGSRLLERAVEVFRRGASAARGQGSRSEFIRAEERFAAAVREVDAVLDEEGEGVAGGTVHRLYADLAHMHARMGAYDPGEVSRWAGRMGAEIGAYAARMEAMRRAAVDEAWLDDAEARISSAGLTAVTRASIAPEPGGEPFAWALAGTRA